MAVLLNWDDIPEPDDYSPLPDGKYHIKVSKIEEKTTKNGDEMWAMTLEVLKSEYAGRKLFDNLTFSEKGIKRVKLVLSRLGVALLNGLMPKPITAFGKEAIVDVVTDDYTDNNGNTKKKNTVLFAGYESVNSSVSNASPVTVGSASPTVNDLPF